MRLFFIVLHLVITAILIGVVLLQKTESGGAGQQRISRGSGNLLTKMTWILAIVFACNSLLIAWLVKREAPQRLLKTAVPTLTPEPATNTSDGSQGTKEGGDNANHNPV